ncbi:MAG: hypothetical protein KIT84_28705 [Labilithrix sp.]|nr:hypothetical protein [Labilithrix sp.]MCW5815041.1 hypothetical protein [Labilithrix sp.]
MLKATSFAALFVLAASGCTAAPADDHADTSTAAVVTLATDPSFGASGVVDVHQGCFGAAPLQDGKVLAVCTGSSGIYRFDADGGVDRTFGEHAGVTWSSLYLPLLRVAPDGRIYLVSQNGSDRILVQRLTPEGARDTSFGDGSVVRIEGARSASRVATISPEGELLLGLNEAGGSTRVLALGDDGAVARSIEVPFGPRGEVSSIAHDAAGRLVVAGVDGATSQPALARFIDGVLDPSFGTNGVATIDFRDGGYACGVEPLGGAIYLSCATSREAAIARVTDDGALDPSWATAGFLVAGYGWSRTMSFDPFGRLILLEHGELRRFDARGAVELTLALPGSLPVGRLSFQADGKPIASFARDVSRGGVVRFLPLP